MKYNVLPEGKKNYLVDENTISNKGKYTESKGTTALDLFKKPHNFSSNFTEGAIVTKQFNKLSIKK
jgi:hypothetical protein